MYRYFIFLLAMMMATTTLAARATSIARNTANSHHRRSSGVARALIAYADSVLSGSANKAPWMQPKRIGWSASVTTTAKLFSISVTPPTSRSAAAACPLERSRVRFCIAARSNAAHARPALSPWIRSEPRLTGHALAFRYTMPPRASGATLQQWSSNDRHHAARGRECVAGVRSQVNGASRRRVKFSNSCRSSADGPQFGGDHSKRGHDGLVR